MRRNKHMCSAQGIVSAVRNIVKDRFHHLEHSSLFFFSKLTIATGKDAEYRTRGTLEESNEIPRTRESKQTNNLSSFRLVNSKLLKQTPRQAQNGSLYK